MVCDTDHDEPMTLTVEADNDDEAMDMMMEEVKAHLGEMHEDMADKSDEELKEMILGKWKKEEGEAADA